MDDWLTANPNPVYSKDAIEFANQVFSQEVGGNRVRKQPFRSSSVGMCERRRIFSAAGLPELGTIDSKLSNIFGTGNFLHLKWQMAGLTEGWLAQAEMAEDLPHLRFGGTMDGLLHDGSGFEFKTINTSGYSHVLNYGPKAMHIRQVHSYMMLWPGITAFSIVYEDKNTGDWREFLVERDDAVMQQLDKELHSLNMHYEARQLPKILPDCQTMEGAVYRSCPFRDRCLKIKKWPST